MMPFKKSSVPQLDTDAAFRILEHTFETNEIEPNSIPLDVLVSYSAYRRERFSMQKTVLIVVMVLFLMLPFLFIPASFTITAVESDHSFNPVYTLNVDSFMLVERVNASIEGHNIPVYEMDSHVYSIEPSRNGKMAVTVTLINRQTLTAYIDVTGVDATAPSLISTNSNGEKIYLYLSDADTGIDYDNIYATDSDGEKLLPDAFDEDNGYVMFPSFEGTLNVYIPDHADNTLHLILKTQ